MDDLISRVAACECIGKMIHEYREKGEYALADGMILVRRYGIKRLPAVNAAPVVHGNWIECYERSRHYYCSNCGKVQGIASIVMKYCPECGAKMAEHPWSGRYTDQSGAEYADNPTV
jgi:hypothetical protein